VAVLDPRADRQRAPRARRPQGVLRASGRARVPAPRRTQCAGVGSHNRGLVLPLAQGRPRRARAFDARRRGVDNARRRGVRATASGQAREATALGSAADRHARASRARPQGHAVALDRASASGALGLGRATVAGADQGATLVPGRARRRPVDGRCPPRAARVHALGSAQELLGEHHGRGDAGHRAQRILPERRCGGARAPAGRGATRVRPASHLLRRSRRRIHGRVAGAGLRPAWHPPVAHRAARLPGQGRHRTMASHVA
jgi:hypothetical protein